MKLYRNIRVATFVIAIATTMLSCKLIQQESQKTTRQGFYGIQPETLLDALAHGDSNAFVPVSEQDVDRSAPPTGSPVNWTQSDYFQIVDAFYKLVLQDSLDDWNINSIDLARRCKDADVGWQDGSFEFFKIVRDKNNQEILISRFIEVDPSSKVVLLWEREFSPYVVDRSSIDLAKIKFDGEKVLQIAEDGGGREARLSVNNACSIRVGLSPDSPKYRGWNSVYTRSDSGTSAFQINVDPFNGEIHR
jgi:hypothetical protein